MVRLAWFVIVAVIASGIQVISSQGPPPPPPGVPERCWGPPKDIKANPADCCKIKPHELFDEDALEECGIDKNQPHGPHRGPPDCVKQSCLLNKYNLIKEDGKLDYEGIGGLLDKWAENDSEVKEVVDKAKDKCLGKTLPGPPQICEADKLAFCLATTVFVDCPKWEDNESCNALKSHIEDCKQYFPMQ